MSANTYVMLRHVSHLKGSNKLPPVGPVGLGMNVAREMQQTLETDARNLVDDILKHLHNEHNGGQTNQDNNYLYGFVRSRLAAAVIQTPERTESINRHGFAPQAKTTDMP